MTHVFIQTASSGIDSLGPSLRTANGLLLAQIRERALLNLHVLLQETRTIWSNNVVEGVWHGPTQLPTVTPPPQQAVVGMPVPKQV